MMMTLGWFVFMRSTVAPQSQQDERAWRHPGNNRVGARPSYQYLGPDDELSTLSGVLYPELTGGPVSLDMLNSMGDSGQAFPLIQGDGVMRGSFVIEGISTTRSEFFQDGSARKIEFSIKLKRVDDNDSSLGNTLLGRTAGNLLGRLGLGTLLNTVGGKLGGLL
ncbi:phage tail protein [Aeromonas sobria]|jgi:phage protein U|uniref:Phage tail protein n=2 Tax=Aeromonas sobria TaxID=646 RepID=A0A1S2CUQ3_AERSO|nr:phage tail protein [Aeromonas sobria]MBS4688576.1 phage tail protein [Aeromonas sobria]OHY92474.1 phage tail protein [Aeromonas sobria]